MFETMTLPASFKVDKNTLLIGNQIHDLKPKYWLKPDESLDYHAAFKNFLKSYEGHTFKTIIDSGFSEHMQKGHLNNFYSNIARLLDTDGNFITISLSDKSIYCKVHCPKRCWTHIDGKFTRFSSKSSLLHHSAPWFKNQRCTTLDSGDFIFHVCISSMDQKRLKSY